MASPSSATPLPAFLGPPYPPPLKAPVQIDGTDVSLGTEVLPPPPPLVSGSGKRASEASRKRILPSYLPSTDPGSTYNAGTGVKVVELTSRHEETENDRNHKRKRQRTEKAESSRARRGSNLATSTSVEVLLPLHKTSVVPKPLEEPSSAEVAIARSSPSLPPVPEVIITSLPPHLSAARSRRSSSLLAASRLSQLDWTASGNGKRKDREGSSGDLAIDAESTDATIETPDGPISIRDPGKGKGKAKEDFINSANCSTCSVPLIYAIGGSVDCDGCPRSFHLACVDPPIEEDVGQNEWFCKKCTRSKLEESSKPLQLSKGTGGPFADLIHKVSSELPAIFLLPEDVRNHFRDVGTAPNGSYVDTSELRVGRPNKFGAVEDRDPYRLKDRGGSHILCYKCHLSAAPPSNPVESVALDPPSAVDSGGNKGKEIERLMSEAPEVTVKSERGGSMTVTDLRSELHLWVTPGSASMSPSPAPSQSQLPPETSNSKVKSRSSSRRSSRRLAVTNSSGASTPTPEPPAAIPPIVPALPPSIPDAKTGPGLMFKPSDTASGWKSMISCDYCNTSWHLDCLKPPLVSLPPAHKKWMCPNHTDHILPKRRIPRNVKTIIIPPASKFPRPPTYGNIEVIPDVESRPIVDPNGPSKKRRTSGFAEPQKKFAPPVVLQDVFRNGVRYKLPEKTIHIDFWNFTNKSKAPALCTSVEPAPLDLVRERARRTLSSSSSLSSLSTTSDSDDDPMDLDATSTGSEPSEFTLREAAETLIAMQTHPQKARHSAGVQTETSNSSLGLESLYTFQNNGSDHSVKSLAELMRTILSTRSNSPSSTNPPSATVLTPPTTTAPVNEPTSPSKSSVQIPSSPHKSPSLSFKIRIPPAASRLSSSNVTTSTNGSATAVNPPPSNGKGATASSKITLNGKGPNSRRSSKKQEGTTQSAHESLSSSSLQNGHLSRATHMSHHMTMGTSNLSSPPITGEELEQLKAVRELLLRKGEKALLDFIRS